MIIKQDNRVSAKLPFHEIKGKAVTTNLQFVEVPDHVALSLGKHVGETEPKLAGLRGHESFLPLAYGPAFGDDERQDQETD